MKKDDNFKNFFWSRDGEDFIGLVAVILMLLAILITTMLTNETPKN